MDIYIIIAAGIIALFALILLPRWREGQYRRQQANLDLDDGFGTDNSGWGDSEFSQSDAWGQPDDNSSSSGYGGSGRRGRVDVRVGSRKEWETTARSGKVAVFSTPNQKEALKVLALLESNDIAVHPEYSGDPHGGARQINLTVDPDEINRARDIIDSFVNNPNSQQF